MKLWTDGDITDEDLFDNPEEAIAAGKAGSDMSAGSLPSVVGSGSGGRITGEDVRRALDSLTFDELWGMAEAQLPGIKEEGNWQRDQLIAMLKKLPISTLFPNGMPAVAGGDDITGQSPLSGLICRLPNRLSASAPSSSRWPGEPNRAARSV